MTYQGNSYIVVGNIHYEIEYIVLTEQKIILLREEHHLDVDFQCPPPLVCILSFSHYVGFDYQ